MSYNVQHSSLSKIVQKMFECLPDGFLQEQILTLAPKGILLIDVGVLYPLGYLACPWQTAPIYLPFEIENVTEGK